LGFEAQPNLQGVIPLKLGGNIDFFSNLPTGTRSTIKNRSYADIYNWITGGVYPLLAEEATVPSNTFNTIGIDTFPDTNSTGLLQHVLKAISTSQITLNPDGTTSVISSQEIGVPQISISKNNIFQATSSKVNVATVNIATKTGVSEIRSSQISPININTIKFSSNEIGFTEISIADDTTTKIGTRQINATQIFPSPVPNNNTSEGEISSSSSIEAQNFTVIQPFSINHNISSQIQNIELAAISLWQQQLHSTTPIDLNFAITNLPTGQLAEATITGYDQLGRPNTATISIDDDANGVGWFIDPTPGDNSEFTGTDTYFQATPNSAAAGKYDLLTTILHEMGHTLGIINGYSEFDKYIKGRQFITDTFTANLTPDGSHLDTAFHPYDLMNTSLKSGVRKLPSALNLAMIGAINAGVGGRVSGVGINTAHLTAGALIGITNGDFTTPTTWNTAGATNIINGTATLTEQSQKLSEITQAFIIPQGAKTLQFTIKDNHLVTGDTTKTANDAFEVALLDTNTFNPLAGTSIGLNHTDSLLNIQANGTIHKSDKVTITSLGNNSSIVTIDLTQITPTTQATLYFNLLGFGARISTVTIDDVKLFTDTQPIPITKNDTLNTNQNTPLTLDLTQLTTNDTNVTQIQVINQPTHGTLTQTTDGKFTYQPIPTYVGTDSFTYLGFGSDGQISNLATVNLTINNLPPTIQTVTIPTKINEGQNIQLSATATDCGSSNNLTYTWNLGDGSNPIVGRNIAHTYTDNGNYDVTLTVTDADGGSTQQTTTVKVDNLAPIVNLTAPTTTLNHGESLNLGVTYSDAGIKDTHTITWNFGDGSAPVTLVGALGFAAPLGALPWSGFPTGAHPQPNLQSLHLLRQRHLPSQTRCHRHRRCNYHSICQCHS
jgi:PKD domain/Bacterial Ig domain